MRLLAIEHPIGQFGFTMLADERSGACISHIVLKGSKVVCLCRLLRAMKPLPSDLRRTLLRQMRQLSLPP